jgi:hypothetical protein
MHALLSQRASGVMREGCWQMMGRVETAMKCIRDRAGCIGAQMGRTRTVEAERTQMPCFFLLCRRLLFLADWDQLFVSNGSPVNDTQNTQN